MLPNPTMVAGMVTVARFMGVMVMGVRALALALAEGASAVGMVEGVSAVDMVADSVAINENACSNAGFNGSFAERRPCRAASN